MPCGPVGPVVPCGPWMPCGPCAPVAPAGPWAPCSGPNWKATSTATALGGSVVCGEPESVVTGMRKAEPLSTGAPVTA